VKEPRRAALGTLYETLGSEMFDRTDLHPLNTFSNREQGVLRKMLEKKLNSPTTTSAGRLFDAVASILDIRQRCAFEGQAAMELEFLADDNPSDQSYTFSLSGNRPAPPGKTGVAPDRVIDWAPMLLALLNDLTSGVPKGIIAAKFHNTLADIIVTVARETGIQQIALTGGCFQNRILTERAVQRLQEEGLRPYWHQRVPPNDGGIALGQLNAAALAQPLH
jgi:hydrogenase maturation protein HypF